MDKSLSNLELRVTHRCRHRGLVTRPAERALTRPVEVRERVGSVSCTTVTANHRSVTVHTLASLFTFNVVVKPTKCICT